MFRREGDNWVRKKCTETINFVEEDYPTDEDDSEGDFEFDMGRLPLWGVNKVGPQEAPTTVQITPAQEAQYRTKILWTTDSGVRKTLLAEKHYWKIRSHNPDVKLRHRK